MKRLLFFVICVSMINVYIPILCYESPYHHTVYSSDLKDGILYSDDEDLEQDETSTEISTRSAYMKAGLWTVVAGLMVHFYPKEFIEHNRQIFVDNFQAPFFYRGPWYRIKHVFLQDFSAHRSGFPEKNSIVITLVLLGTYHVASNTFRSWYEAYCMYIRQHPRHGSSSDHGICRDEQNEMEV